MAGKVEDQAYPLLDPGLSSTLHFRVSMADGRAGAGARVADQLGALGAARTRRRSSRLRALSGRIRFRPTATSTGVALAVTAIALALGTFDAGAGPSSIANVASPTIAGNLSASVDQGTWVITSFAVANGVSVPMTGWLMARYGVVKTFVVSVILFTVASFLCGISWNLASLIAFRVLQGAVSGPMIPGSQSLMIMIFPARQRGTALAIWSMTTLVAPVAGPGDRRLHLRQPCAWPWLFLINLPVGAICAPSSAGAAWPGARRRLARRRSTSSVSCS